MLLSRLILVLSSAICMPNPIPRALKPIKLNKRRYERGHSGLLASVLRPQDCLADAQHIVFELRAVAAVYQIRRDRHGGITW